MSTRIFLADDHAIVRDGLRLLLETQPGYQVVGTALNGRDALAQLEALTPEIAILDIAMPEMNGLEVARHMQHLCPQTRVIMLSMHRAPEYVVQALDAGARGYVIKESAGEEVLEAVRVVRAGERYLSPAIADTVLDYYVRMRRTGAEVSPLERLNERECEILRRLAEGQTSAEIAAQLSLSVKTVDTYRSNLMHKLDIHHLPGLVKFAIQHGLASL